MSRSLSSPTSDASAAVVTQPGYLVEIEFSTPLRLSSRGTLDVLGNTFIGWDVRISGLTHSSQKPAVSGQLTLGDHDQSMSALVLGEGVNGRQVSVWRYFAEAVALDDPVLIFKGACGAASGGMSREVTIELTAKESTVLFAPRRYMTHETGFHALPPNGKTITFNGEKYVLEQER